MDSSSSSSSMPRWEYDVFLSFHGKDTRNHFVACLHMFLSDLKGFRIFIDDKELERGKSISELMKKINESRIAVIVFSENYASSSWCLDELVEILECRKNKKQIVLPLFYDVKPSDVKKQTGKFGEAFTRKHEGIHTAERWREALKEAAEISGLDLDDAANGNWPKFFQQIGQEISTILQHRTLKVAEYEVGIDSRASELIMLLNDSSKDKLFVGICGTGGIGKTTVAKAVFNGILNKFERSCFLNNVREESTKHGLDKLQEELLRQALKDNDIRISNIDVGIKVVEERLQNKKILIVIDDVDDEKQLLYLVGIGHNWFGSGSRIIITTRNEWLLRKYGVKICKAKLLDDHEALELFSWHAFKQNSPPEAEFLRLSNRVIEYAQGLPLALQVLGSHLCRRSIGHWESELHKLKRNPPKQIQDVLDLLQISYDGLDNDEKSIFLDIACFFKGYDKNIAMDFFESSTSLSEHRINVLIERSLVTMSECNKLLMHDLIQEMGQKIVSQESKNPAKRSRLWLYEDIREVFDGDTVPKNIEGIMLTEVGEEGLIVNPDAFSKMKKLRILILNGGELLQCPKFLPNQLRYIQWKGYPGECLPQLPKRLVRLELPNSRIKQILMNKNFLENLKLIDLSSCEYLVETLNFYGLPCLEKLDLEACGSVVEVKFHDMMKKLRCIVLNGCENLKKTPNLSRLPCLEKLSLRFCKSLVEVHPSIEFHERLVELDFDSCENMKSLSTRINLKSLIVLNLNGCFKLEKFPEIQGDMKYLKDIYLNGTGIKELPSSVKHLKGLTLLFLTSNALKDLPSSIEHLKVLERLDLSDCKMLESLPSNIGEMKSLKELDLSGTAIKDLPPSVEHLKALEKLNLCDCRMLKSLPSNFGEMKSLKELDLSRTAIKDLPSSVEHLKGLEQLSLRGCKMLESLPNNIGEMKSLTQLWLHGTGIKSLPNNIGEMERLMSLTLAGSCIRKLPSSIAQLTHLTELDCDNCNLDEESILNLPHSLRDLNLSRNSFASLPASFMRLTNLGYLKLDGCLSLQTLESLPSSIRKVSAQGCVSLEWYCSLTSKSNSFTSREWIFTESHKLVENHGKNKPNIYSESLLQDIGSTCILLPGDEIPSWFNHICESGEDRLCLTVDPNSCTNLKGIAVCAVIGIDHEPSDYRVYFSLLINGSAEVSLNLNNWVKSSSDHIILSRRTHALFRRRWLMGNHDACFIEASISSGSGYYVPLKVKKWGIHLEIDAP